VSGGEQRVDEHTRFDTSAGLPMCTAQPPGGRGPWMARVNPTPHTGRTCKGAFAVSGGEQCRSPGKRSAPGAFSSRHPGCAALTRATNLRGCRVEPAADRYCAAGNAPGGAESRTAGYRLQAEVRLIAFGSSPAPTHPVVGFGRTRSRGLGDTGMRNGGPADARDALLLTAVGQLT